MPLHATKYRPQVNDIVLGTIVTRNPEFYQMDINADTYAILNTQEF